MSAVDENLGTSAMCAVADFPDRIDQTQNVRHVSEHHEFGTAREKRVELVESQTAILLDIDEAQSRPSALGGQLPGEEVVLRSKCSKSQPLDCVVL